MATSASSFPSPVAGEGALIATRKAGGRSTPQPRISSSPLWNTGSSTFADEDVGHNFSSPRRDALRPLRFRSPFARGHTRYASKQRARGMPGVRCTRGLCKKCMVVATGSPGSHRHSLRNGFTVSFVLSPVTGLCCHRRRRDARKTPGIIANLTPASGRQDHTIAVRISRASSPRRLRPSLPAPNVRDDRDTPLFSGAGWRKMCC